MRTLVANVISLLCLALVCSTASAQQGGVEVIENGPFRVELVGEVVIDAPLEAVWEALIDVAAYPEWNPAVLEVSPAGADVTRRGQLLDVTLALGNRARKQRVEVQNAVAPGPDGRAEWVYRNADFAASINWLKAQRNHQLEAVDAHSTRVMIAEIFTGFVWAAPVSDTRVHLEHLLAALAVRARELAD